MKKGKLPTTHSYVSHEQRLQPAFGVDPEPRQPNRRFYTIQLTRNECELLIDAIDKRVNESDRRNNSGIAPEYRNRTAKLVTLLEVKAALETAMQLGRDA